MRYTDLIGGVVIAGLVGTAAGAQALSDWDFQITPYGWMAGLDGDLGTFPGLPPAEVDLSFGDILDNLDVGLMLLASARNGPWVIYLDTTYVKLSTRESGGGVVLDSVKIESETTTLSLAVGRTIMEARTGSVDAYVGARAWWLDNSFELRGIGGGVARTSEDTSWVSPILGVAGRFRPVDRWTVFGALEVGGFGVGADSEWSVIVGSTYDVNERVGITFGYRHLDVDYDDDGILFDVAQSGPLIGATFRF